MYWLIDFESFKFCGEEYIVKEICILNSNGTECYNYFVKSPSFYHSPDDNKTINFQYNRHRIPWNYGDYTFKDAIEDIWKKVGANITYVKGLEKKQFLEKFLFRVGELDMVPPFKKLNAMRLQWCEHRHGIWCARRKVYEIKNYIDTYKIILHE
jgi:hypothetical protein